jgi:hypothetical protein
MTFYILLPGDERSYVINDANILGESSFNIFWAGEGLKALMKISDNNPEVLEQVEIITDKSNKLTVAEFLNVIDKLEVRVSQ